MNNILVDAEWIKKAFDDSSLISWFTKLTDRASLSFVVRKIDRADWLIRILAFSGILSHKQLVKIACLCARKALRFVPTNEHKVIICIETTELWIEDKATIEEVEIARRRCNSASAAAYAASHAASYASHAASYAAYAASYAAYAAYAASYAAYAASHAASYAAHAASEEKEHKELCDIIRKEIKIPKFKKAKIRKIRVTKEINL